MRQHQLNCDIARITGESVCTIRRRGFSLLPLPSSPESSNPMEDLYGDLPSALAAQLAALHHLSPDLVGQ